MSLESYADWSRVKLEQEEARLSKLASIVDEAGEKVVVDRNRENEEERLFYESLEAIDYVGSLRNRFRESMDQYEDPDGYTRLIEGEEREEAERNRRKAEFEPGLKAKKAQAEEKWRQIAHEELWPGRSNLDPRLVEEFTSLRELYARLGYIRLTLKHRAALARGQPMVEPLLGLDLYDY